MEARFLYLLNCSPTFYATRFELKLDRVRVSKRELRCCCDRVYSDPARNWQDGHRIRRCVSATHNLLSRLADSLVSLTNQPVVIDNVSRNVQESKILLTCCRAPAISRLVSPERSNHRVIFLHCRPEAHVHYR